MNDDKFDAPLAFARKFLLLQTGASHFFINLMDFGMFHFSYLDACFRRHDISGRGVIPAVF
jgi:hypothetical protein